MLPHPHDLSTLLSRLALDTGFNLAAITRPNPSPRSPRRLHRQWIADNKHGRNALPRRAALDERLDITKKNSPEAKSILCVALAYHQPDPYSRTQH